MCELTIYLEQIRDLEKACSEEMTFEELWRMGRCQVAMAFPSCSKQSWGISPRCLFCGLLVLLSSSLQLWAQLDLNDQVLEFTNKSLSFLPFSPSLLPTLLLSSPLRLSLPLTLIPRQAAFSPMEPLHTPSSKTSRRRFSSFVKFPTKGLKLSPAMSEGMTPQLWISHYTQGIHCSDWLELGLCNPFFKSAGKISSTQMAWGWLGERRILR